ncbi:hypothetical protein C9374_005695 [Naegleria lovaniensis]|uniref:Uncharacterized protein n=1 Tax=Naegleria lovaniensis TaxID=51637 RepID=A0AA88KJI9_NAELO|nr:uncharacterized protein C9374_005695 [Naegleria lovaniensis]KAG2381903.1 hypothetical protein C9374_005695 [Naegleria lovaniensis]
MTLVKNPTRVTNVGSRTPAQASSSSSIPSSSSNEKPLRHVSSGTERERHLSKRSTTASTNSVKIKQEMVMKQENKTQKPIIKNSRARTSNLNNHHNTNPMKNPENRTGDTSVMRPLNAPISEAIQQKTIMMKQQQQQVLNTSTSSAPTLAATTSTSHSNSVVVLPTTTITPTQAPQQRLPLKQLLAQLACIGDQQLKQSLQCVLKEIDQYIEESAFSTIPHLVDHFNKMHISEDVNTIVKAFQYLKNLATHATNKIRMNPPNAYYDLMTCLRVAYHLNTLRCLDKIIESGRNNCIRRFFLLNTDLSLLFNETPNKQNLKTEGMNTGPTFSIPKPEPVNPNPSSTNSLIPSEIESLSPTQPQQPSMSHQPETTGHELKPTSNSNSNSEPIQLMNLPIKQETTIKRQRKFTSQVKTSLIVYWNQNPTESGTEFFRSETRMRNFLRHASLDDSYMQVLKQNAGSILIEYENARSGNNGVA